jgi:hypothetical protein
MNDPPSKDIEGENEESIGGAPTQTCLIKPLWSFIDSLLA